MSETTMERAPEFEEDIATVRLAEVAAHYGWSDKECIWRIFNALAHQDPIDIATLIWSIDFVASEGSSGPDYKPMLNSTLPRDRSNDRLYEFFTQREAEALTFMSGPRKAAEMVRRLRQPPIAKGG